MREQVRVSMGTLRVLGMELLKTETDPTTAYLQTYHAGRCLANCMFCAQARGSSARDDNIARGFYPPRDTSEVISRLSKAYEHRLLERACIQTMNYQNMFDDLLYLIDEIRKNSTIPISVSLYPFPRKRFIELRESGADKLVIPLDAVTETIFEEIKGRRAFCPYTWQSHTKALNDAVRIFGKTNVGTHLILGLGETERDALHLIHALSDKGIYSALFAYTPITSAQMHGNAPEIGHYRRIQLASHLIEEGLSTPDRMQFAGDMIVDFGIEHGTLDRVISSGKPFLTRGCPGCNRPYSTESPGGLIYNYPMMPSEGDIETIKSQLRMGIR
jgi:biotin synthase-related radical SAM superfamily protein